MHGPFLGEFMGTLVLILLGDGVVANVLLKKSKGENSGWIVITTGWGMAVVAGIFTAIAFGSPGAHINPAITLTVALLSGNWSNVGLFWGAQVLGAFAGASLVWLTYLPPWKVTPDAGAKLAIFCTTPAIRNLPANLLTEIIATTCLTVVGFSFGSKAVSGSGLPAAGHCLAPETEAHHGQASSGNNFGQKIRGQVADGRRGAEYRQFCARVRRHFPGGQIGQPDETGAGEGSQDLRGPEEADVRPVSREQSHRQGDRRINVSARAAE